MTRSKIIAILTGAISILLALAYLIIVFFLDARGEMKPAPISYFPINSQQVTPMICNLNLQESLNE